MSLKYIGKDLPISDCWEKVFGSAKYVSDINLDNMLHISLIYSPYPNCIVKSVNASAALAVEGVRNVFHCFNTSEKLFNRFRTFYGQQVYNQERVFNEHLRFVGDRAAAVVAESKEIADKAARMVKIEYEQLPYSLDIPTTLSGKIDDIFPDGAVYELPVEEISDVGSIGGDVVEVESYASLGRITHVTMETHGCIADYSKQSGELVIMSPNQSVFSVRTVIGDLLDIPYNKIRVIKTIMGGSFGAKQEWIVEPVAAYIAKEMGQPVKLVYERSEEMVSAVSRSPMLADIKTYFTKDGVLQGLAVDASVDAGAYIGNSYDYALAMGHKFTRNYRIPYLKYKSRAVVTNTPVSGAFRGWTSPEATIMLEHNLDVAAKKLGIDPLELRLKNAYVEGDVDIKGDIPLENTQIVRCLREGAQMFEWQKKQADNKQFNCENDRYKRGVAVACGGHVSGYYPRKQDFGTAAVSVNEDGTVNVNITIHDHGCGTVVCFKMIAAEVLGIDLEDILLQEGDTAVTPFDMGCFSSRTTYVLGRTLEDCCKKVVKEVLCTASLIYNLPIEKLTYKEGNVYCGGEFLATFKEVGRDSILRLQKQIYVTAEHINVTNPGVHGVHFAEVQVDTYTGFVKVLDYLAVHDIGKALNRGMCIAQIQGAVTMGVGAALQEKLQINQNGAAKNSLKDYHLMTDCDLPEIKVHLIEEPSKEGPFGAKSIGEVCHVPVTAVIIGAVNDALGSSICQIPMNPDLILRYVSQGEVE